MSSESGYFKLGLFVIVGFVLLIIGIVALGAGAFMVQYVHLETATTESVQGLEVGAAVKYSGVTVGKVSKIDIASWRYQSTVPEVNAAIRKYIVIDFDVRRNLIPAHAAQDMPTMLQRSVEEGLRVRMGSSGLTGPPYLEITNLDPKSYPQPTLPWTPVRLYIPSAPSTMTQIVSGIEGIMSQVRDMNLPKLSEDTDRLINTANTSVADLKTAALRDKAAALLDEANKATADARTLLNNPEINRILKNVSDTTASLKETVGGDEVKAFVADLPKISARLKETVDRVDNILADPKTKAMLDGLAVAGANSGPAVEDARQTMHQLSVLLTAERNDLALIIANLRNTTENAAAFTGDAKANPSNVLFGEPPPHFNEGGRK